MVLDTFKDYSVNEVKSFVNSFKSRDLDNNKEITTSMIKYAYGINPYSVWNKMISKKTIGNKCLRCSEVETWDHVIKYKETILLR